MKNLKLLIVNLIFFILAFSTNAQNEKLNSLFDVVKNSQHDTILLQALIDIGDIYENYIPDSALYFYKIANAKAQLNCKVHKAKYTDYCINYFEKTQAKTLRYIGLIYKAKTEFDTAMIYYSKSLKIYQNIKDDKGIAACFSNIGSIYYITGKYDKSIEFYLKSLKISEKLENKRGMIAEYTNLGIVHSIQKNFITAIDYFLKSLKIAEDINDKKSISQCLNNIGSLYYENNDFLQALNYFVRAVKISEEINDKYGASTSYINIGEVYKKQENYSNAAYYFHKSLNIKKELDDLKGIATIYNNLSLMYFEMSKTKKLKNNKQFILNKSLEYGLNTIKITHKNNLLQLEHETLQNLMQIYKEQGNFKKALDYALLFIDVKDSLFNKDKTQAIQDAETKFNTEKKQLQIEKLNKENQLKQSEILRTQEKNNRQYIIILIILISLILILIFTFILFKRLKTIQEQKNTIQIQKNLVEEKISELNQTNEEIKAQRDEIEKQRDFIKEQKSAITNSINYAQKIQQAVLPNKEYLDSILGDYFILSKSKDIVSGDFYWATKVDNLLIFTVVDCTGHGVPGALMSMLGVSFLNDIVIKKKILKANEILDSLRISVIEALQQKGNKNDQKDGMEASICVLDTTNNILQYAGAFIPLFLMKNLKELKFIIPDKQPIAYYEYMKPFTNHEIQLEKNDCIYITTDGYRDQYGGANDKRFTTKRLKELFINIASKPMSEQELILSKTFDNWKTNQDQIDDVTIFGIKI